MYKYRRIIAAGVIGSALAGGALLAPAALAQAPAPALTPLSEPANERLRQLGPEGSLLARRVGTWDASFTSWDRPGAVPTTVTGLVAEREMFGPMLQERLRSGPGELGQTWTRLDDITFNRTEGRWDYMSMDTRFAVGMMFAWSLDHDPVDRIFVSFQPFAVPGDGMETTGQLTRMEQVVIRMDDDHDQKDQYFTPADGTGTKWLAKRYTYVRHH